MHTLLDLRDNIPTAIIITDGKVHDVKALDNIMIEAGAIYIMDRGYLYFKRLYAMHQSLGFFVTRAKRNFDFRRLYSLPVDKSTGIQCDQVILLNGFYALPALTIADLYRCRWQVELFFKWIKQHLRIKAFHGTTENAVKTQIWIAISVYVLVAIIKKQLKLEQSLYSILQILSVTLFEKTLLSQAFSEIDSMDSNDVGYKQLNLLD